MFDSKVKTLIEKKEQKATSATTTSKNPFVTASLKKSAETTSTGNGALKYTTTGNDFVDQFGKISNYKVPRSYAEVSKDMSLIWSQNQLDTLKLSVYIRMITRQVQLFSGEKTEASQRGQGLKNEGIMRLLWIATNHPSTFWKNVEIFVSTGCWKDIIQMLSLDLQYHSWKDRKLDWNNFGSLILAGLENPNTSELVKKYLPTIKSNSFCTTLESQADNIIGKWICSLLFGGKTEETSGKKYKLYRKLKSSGTAHEWQQLISQGKFLQINFDTIHGRALSQLVSGKFLANQGLEEKYQEWIAKKPVAKYTGYLYELFLPLGIKCRMSTDSLKPYQVDTMNKQFLQLVETGKKGLKEGENGFIVVIDSSNSMTSLAMGTKASSYSVAKSLALYFSYLLKGQFENVFLEFSNDTIMKSWKGSTPVEKMVNETSSIIAGTNFLSVADHFGKILKTGVSEKDFPTGIICVSDGCFNNTGRETTNFKAFKKKLLDYGFTKEFVDNFKVVLWDIPNGYYTGIGSTTFEDFADCPNLFHMSGLDGSAIAFLTGTTYQTKVPTTSEEMLGAALDQEVLNMLEV